MNTMDKMKERPILFSGAMVRAILNGKKTQTRRVIKNQKLGYGAPKSFAAYEVETSNGAILFGFENDDNTWICPYGKVGDRLWVRETFGHNGCMNCHTHYKADEPNWKDKSQNPIARWYPSIHMPRWASRITLQITGIRVERLCSITNADAHHEGVDPIPEYGSSSGATPSVVWNYRDPFFNLWKEIHGKESLKINPWVWVIDFKVV